MAPVIMLKSRVPDADQLRGRMLTEANVAIKLEGDADVFKPDGTPLCMLRRGAIPSKLTEGAYDALHEIRKYKTDNRGSYAGATRTASQFADGSFSKNSRTRTVEGKRHMVASAVVGFYDRQGGRFPYCRQTMFTTKEPMMWSTIVPMVEHVGKVFRHTAPKRYEKQMAEVVKAKDYMIGGTPFTTLTVNNNVAPAATHTDKGDFKDGLGVISVVRRGVYSGSWLVFPEYMVGVDLRDGDVFFFNSHDLHGVTAMVSESEDAERISVVYYARSRITECLPLREELARAKARGEFAKEET